MKKHFGIWDLILVALPILLAIMVVGLIALEIYIWVTYWGVPISEIPAWALFFMFRKGGR